MRLTLTAPAAIEATDTDARTLSGVAIPYGQRGVTSAGPVVIDAGAIRVPDNLRAVKLFREHGRVTPLGYALEAADDDQALRMVFRVAATADGDQALVEASEGLRDALSVELNDVRIEAGHVVSADLVAVAQTAVPAFAGAQLAATLSDDDQAQVHDLAGQIADLTAPQTEDTEDTPPADDTPTPESESSMTTTTEASAAPAALTMTTTTPARRTPDNDRTMWASAAAEAMRGATDAGQVNAALADIVPSTSTTDVFPRPSWIGELWTPAAVTRPLINAIGVSPLTAMQMQGWKWETEPQVAPYAGEKTEVPTSPAKAVPATADAQRIAGGWDLDRIYVDFNTGFVEAFQRAAVADYTRKSQGYLVNGHAAITGPPAIPAYDGIADGAHDLGVSASVIDGIAACVSYLVGNGANVSFVAIASNLFTDLIGLQTGDAPWWLQGQGAVSLDGSASAAGVNIVVDPDAPNGQILAGDRAAVTLWETGPINVTAVNLPNGGIDFALFGYYASMVHDDRGLVKTTGPTTPLSTAKKTAAKA